MLLAMAGAFFKAATAAAGPGCSDLVWPGVLAFRWLAGGRFGFNHRRTWPGGLVPASCRSNDTQAADLIFSVEFRSASNCYGHLKLEAISDCVKHQSEALPSIGSDCG